MNEKLKNSKKIYDSIEIPPELGEIVAKSIDEQPRLVLVAPVAAKREKTRSMRSKTMKYMAVAVASLLVCTTLGINTLSSNSDKISDIPLIGYLVDILNAGNDEKGDSNDYGSDDTTSGSNDTADSEDTSDLLLGSTYTGGSVEDPSGDEQSLRGATNAETENLYSSATSGSSSSYDYAVDAESEAHRSLMYVPDSVVFNKSIAANSNSFLDKKAEMAINAFVKDAVTRGAGHRHSSADTSYVVKYQNGSILSVAITVWDNSENADPHVYYYNVYLSERQPLTLANILGPGYIPRANNAIVSQINSRLASDSSLVYWGFGDKDGSKIHKGFTTVNADTDFYINSNGNPVVCFKEGEIAPAYMGSQEFEIQE